MLCIELKLKYKQWRCLYLLHPDKIPPAAYNDPSGSPEHIHPPISPDTRRNQQPNVEAE
jgi:hypothetical protein